MFSSRASTRRRWYPVFLTLSSGCRVVAGCGIVGVVSGAVVPSGTVTFLFTDIEGSTRLWDEHPEAMEVAVERHDRILRDVIAAHGGYVFTTAGDAFAAAFRTVRDGVRAASAAQRAFHNAVWPEPVEIRARMGLHVGEAQERDGDYFGPVLNRTARLMSAGHGGQVLVSAAVVAVAGEDGMVDLGRHRLKDLTTAEHVWQLGPGSFPPLRTLEAVRHNLPVRRSEVVGRDEELAAVAEHLAEYRLVTVTGMGGAGKTTLAVTAAARAADGFGDGVFFVELAPVSESRLVAATVGEAAGMRLGAMDPDRIDDIVTTFLAGRRCLVALDNCEHLVEAAADVVDRLLSAGDACRVLATSREPLEVEGEHIIRVGPLDVDVAVSLLVERTRAVREEFQPSGAEEVALREICVHLDGIPLALELAAAQLAHLSPVELAARLDDRFELLATRQGRGRARRRTLAAMMDWSWDLLAPHEQQTLAELSVFAGGWTLEAAEAVCGPDAAVPVAATLGGLYGRSLLTRTDTDHGVRYGMLETVRLYSHDRLRDAGRVNELRGRHAGYWAEQAVPQTFAEQADDLGSALTIDRDADNVRAALEWLISQAQPGRGVPLIVAASIAWNLGFAPLRDLLAPMLDADLPAVQRAVVGLAAARERWGAGDMVTSSQQAAHAYDIAAAVGDDAVASVASWMEASTYQIRDPQRAAQLTERALQLAHDSEQRPLVLQAQCFHSLVHTLGLGDPATGARLCREVLAETTQGTYTELVALTSLETALFVAGDWKAVDPVNRRAIELTEQCAPGRGFWLLTERAVIDHELGHEDTGTYQAAIAANEAAGSSTIRPDHLLVPLGRALREHRFDDAGAIVNAYRQLSQAGNDSMSPGVVGIYLNYRHQLRAQGISTADLPAADYHQVVAEELKRRRS